MNQGCEHPLAAAVRGGAESRGMALGTVNGLRRGPAKGSRGNVDRVHAALANAAMMRDRGVEAEAPSA